LPVDLAKNAESMGAQVIRAKTTDELKRALVEAKKSERTVVITIETDRNARVGSFESWWEVPIAEVSEQRSVQSARADYEKKRDRARWHV
jgi:3D-(3,5/4)-trihydroxycyclohexane-1,2-dione acylhydrolase (decyclizing)